MLLSCAVETLNPVTVTFSEGFFLRYCAFCKSLLYFFYFALYLSDKDFSGYFDHFVQFYFNILYFIFFNGHLLQGFNQI